MERTLLDLLKLQAGVLGRTGDPVAQLRELMRAHVRFHCERALEAFVADYELRGLGEEFSPQIRAYRDQYQAAFRAILEAGVQQGVFSVPDIHVTTNTLLVMASGAVTWYHAGGRLSLEEIADIHATLALKAVSAFPPPA